MKSAAIHLAILRSASALVPKAQRADWLDEWRSELWHVQHDPQERNVTAFCTGAFRDAFWLWRDNPAPELQSPFAESPVRCLSWLVALGALSCCAALSLPASRTVLLGALYPRNLVMLTPSGRANPDMSNGFFDPYPSVSKEQFESLMAREGGEFADLVFYTPVHLAAGTPGGKRSPSAALTTRGLLSLLNIPQEPKVPVHAGNRWILPGNPDRWVIEDEPAIAALPPSTEGFVVGRLRDAPVRDSRFQFVRVPDRSFAMLWSVLVMLLFAYVLVAIMTSGSPGGRLPRIGPRRGLFLAAKTLLVLPIVTFGSLVLGSLGGSVSPLFLDVALLSSVFGARWIRADQRKRCPVCLRLLANPVRIGESSRILLEWHGTESMCPRGHGMLYVPEWPAIWSVRQRWMDLGPSWRGLFP